MRRVIGLHSCLEVLKVRPRKIRTLYIQKNWKSNSELKKIHSEAKRFSVNCVEQTREQMASWGEGHQGAALIVEESPRFQFSDDKNNSVLIFIDGLQDPRNLGAILRTAWLMGACALCLPLVRNSIRSLTASVCKAAAGGAEHIPVEFLPKPYHWLKQAKKEGYFIYGLDQKKTHRSLWSESFHKKTVLVVGSESKGLRPKTAQMCDLLLKIPQSIDTGSYNLSVAAALGLSQVFRSFKKNP